jgi:serine/threonine protein kinase/WD40 repeat protein/Tfp pilus assembly protein PilF
MSEVSRFDEAALPQMRRIDAVCAQFEKAWKTGPRPRIDDYLGDLQEPERSLLVRELIALDIDYRRHAGEQPQARDYQTQWPSLDLSEFAGQPATVAPTLSHSELQSAGTLPVIPGYEILGELGRGGMGVVYRAWQTSLHRLVALKMVLAGAHASPLELARFRTEAEAIARLHHPNIVQIYEIGQLGLHPYMALEYVDGGSLAQKLHGSPLPVREAAEWVVTLAHAVHYAHQRGIVHRDLKPANILLLKVFTTEDPEDPEKHSGRAASGSSGFSVVKDFVPKITDFGLAKLLIGGGPTLTESGVFLGTPGYTAPEQAAGKSKEIGPATDIYSLGAILYQLLTGRPPFKAETPQETLAQVQSQEPVSPSRLRPKLPRDLSTICLKCLEKEPGKRYATAEALADDLQRFLAGEPIQARPVSSPEKLWRWCRRRPALASLIITVSLLLVLIAAASITAAILFRGQRDATRLALYYLSQATSSRLTGEQGQSFGPLQLIRDALKLLGPGKLDPAQARELRRQAIACLAALDLRVLQQQDSGQEGDVGGPNFDSHLERYAYADSTDRSLVIRRLADNEILQRLPPPKNIPFWYFSDRFSPDDRFLALHYAISGQQGGLCIVWDLQTPRQMLQVPSVLGWDFHPQRSLFATQTTDGSIRLYQLPEGKESQRFELKGSFYIRFDPHGQRLACASGKLLHILDLQTGKVTDSFTHAAVVGGEGSFAWSKDGRWLAAGCEDHRIYVYDTTEHQLQSILTGHEGNVITVCFSPSTNLLASSSWDNTTRLWDPISGKQWLVVEGQLMRFRADGGCIGVRLNYTVFRTLELVGGQVCRTLHHGALGNIPRPPPKEGLLADFSGDGRLLASASGDGVRLWDALSAQEVASLAIGVTDAAQFNPRGDGLATYGRAGLCYWPLHVVDRAAQGENWQLGPPKRLFPARSNDWYRVAWDRQGERLTFTDFNRHRACLLSLKHPAQRTVLPDWLAQLHVVTISPDGKRVATAARFDATVKVWEASTGKLLATLPGSHPLAYVYQAAFSPDNQWLLVGSDRDYRWWRVDSWEPAGKLVNNAGGAPLAFSGDSRLLALTLTPHTVQLVDPVSGQELATLTAPDEHVIQWLCFNYGGSELAATTAHHRVQLWDLRLLRQQLADVGLDWDRPPYPPANAETPKPIQINVERGDAVWPKPALDPASMRQAIGVDSLVLALNPFNFYAYQHRGDAHMVLAETRPALQDYNLALACMPKDHPRRAEVLQARADMLQELREFAKAQSDLEQVLELAPEQADACNSLAWIYLTGPEKLPNAARALALAKKAVELTPGEWMYLNTLGVAYYRQGQYEQALQTLERSLHDSKGDYAAYDLFFLAMCHARLGDPAKAKDCYERALRWVQQQSKLLPSTKEELNSFRSEAEALLRQQGKP